VNAGNSGKRRYDPLWKELEYPADGNASVAVCDKKN
jgi:hypothetical protein